MCCHPERSEGSPDLKGILHFAQNDEINFPSLFRWYHWEREFYIDTSLNQEKGLFFTDYFFTFRAI